ncbi:hypothetical protein RHSIM_Rhsim05G0144900 [Rhododendron simsii]|uniref:Uncharacterized protein n=1 Tax=Rhododendron simsii TaxID=118357 RepID=A0A834LP40_RHOSS|nr:hypothetical protein RHSIM_Rhsim05G0144900 [Rhododendron simsii]
MTIKEGQGIGTSCRLFPWILLLYKDVNLNDTDITNAYCGKNGLGTNEEMRKDAISLLAEELSLQKDVADDNLQRTKALITGAKKTSSHYQKEAEKCNAGMETCEEAREKAEAGLIEECKLSALWEKRAHEHGWKDERRVYQ